MQKLRRLIALARLLLRRALLVGPLLLNLSGCHRSQSPAIPESHSLQHLPSSQPRVPSDILVFAGLAGSPPRFIDSGPDQGLGWAEYETQRIRRGLMKSGFQIKVEYLTPARIEHEFQLKTPLCTYPVELTPEMQKFSKAPDRYYSIGLTLGEEDPPVLLFKREKLSKFKKHFSPSGSIRLEALARDETLKTVLIRDRTYPVFSELVTERDRNGEQQVKSEFRKNIDLRVVRDNSQLIQMLDGDRFDYTFQNQVESQEFANYNINEQKYISIPITRDRSPAVEANEVAQYVIACTKHPLALRAIPYINDFVRMTRGMVLNNLDYRRQIDPTGVSKSQFTAYERYRGKFDTNQMDGWYREQQRHFPDLLLLPRSLAVTANLSPSRRGVNTRPKSHSIQWALVKESPDAATLFNESDFGPEENPSRMRRMSYSYDVFPQNLEALYLTRDQKRVMWDPRVLETFGFLWGKESRFDSFKNLKELTLFGEGLGVQEFKNLRDLVAQSPGLKRLTIFYAGAPEAQYFIATLRGLKLESLNLTHSSLTLTDLSGVIRDMPLKELHLDNSQISEGQLIQVLKNLPPSVEKLSLGYLRTPWTRSASLAFGSRSWKKLKSLDLESNFFTDSQFLPMLQALPHDLEVLRLGVNYLTPRSARPLLSRLQGLRVLDLRHNNLAFSRSESIRFSSALRELDLSYSRISPASVRNWILPSGITHLNLSGTRLGAAGVGLFLKNLGNEIFLLDLSETLLGSESIEDLVQNRRIERIHRLSLARDQLGTDEIKILSHASFQVDWLDLAGNFLNNSAAEEIAKRWVPRLIGLDLSWTLISEGGVKAVADQLSSSLRSLSLASILDFKMADLAKGLPPNLEGLSLEHNLLSDEDLQTLSQHLPNTLRTLDVRGSLFGRLGSESLAQGMPPRLSALSLSVLRPLPGLNRILEALPQSLRRFQAYFDNDLSPEFLSSLRFPHGVRTLMIGGLERPGKETDGFWANLPRSLYGIEIFSNVSPEGARHLARHWPTNLRHFGLAGKPISSEAGTELISHLPATLGQLGFIGSHLGDDAFKAIEANHLPNLFLFQLFRNPLTEVSLIPIWKAAPHNKHWLIYSAGALRGESSKALRREAFKDTKLFGFTNTTLSESALHHLLTLLPESLVELDLSATGISYKGVDQLIRRLPKYLQKLKIQGNDLGTIGREKLRAYQKRRSERDGVAFQVED